MKNFLTIGGITALVIVCWGVLLGKAVNGAQAQNVGIYIEFAKEQKELEAYGSAIANMKKAVEIENTVENRLMLAHIYKDGGYIENYKESMNGIISSWPLYLPAYEELVSYYYETQNYATCCEVILKAIKQEIHTPEMTDTYYECTYRYIVLGNTYDDLHNYYNKTSIALREGQKYYLNENLEFISKDVYEDACSFLDTIAAVSNDGNAYFIDKEGKKYLDTDKTYKKAYSFNEGLALVVENEEYYYINYNLKKILGPYESATTFSSGIAAVKQGGAWRIIDKSGQYIGKESFEDIIIDEENQCSNMERFFGKQQGAYYMFSNSGKKISDTPYEDARPFYTDKFTAVKKDGMWGFAGIDGVVYIQPQYEDARAFGQNIGAVCVEGLWGFVNINNRMVIEPVFEDAKSLGPCKAAPVKEEGYWRFLKLVL